LTLSFGLQSKIPWVSLPHSSPLVNLNKYSVTSESKQENKHIEKDNKTEKDSSKEEIINKDVKKEELEKKEVKEDKMDIDKEEPKKNSTSENKSSSSMDIDTINNEKLKEANDDNGVKPMELDNKLSSKDNELNNKKSENSNKDTPKEEIVDENKNVISSISNTPDKKEIKSDEEKETKTDLKKENIKENTILENNKKSNTVGEQKEEKKDILINKPSASTNTTKSTSLPTTASTVSKIDNSENIITKEDKKIVPTTEPVISTSLSSVYDKKVKNEEEKIEDAKSENILSKSVATQESGSLKKDELNNKENNISETKRDISEEEKDVPISSKPELNEKSEKEKEAIKIEKEKKEEKEGHIKEIVKGNNNDENSNVTLDTDESNSVSSGIPFSVEPDSLDDDDDDKNDSDNQRKQALEDMKNIEIDFAKLREKIYQEKMEELDNEIEMIKNNTHPDLVESIKKIEAKKDERIRMANAWKHYQLECIDNQFRIYYKELDSSRQSNINASRKDLMDEVQSNRWKIYKEKRKAELNHITSNSGYESVNKFKKRKTSKSEISLLKSMRMTGFSKNELHEDLDLLKIRYKN